MGIWSKSGIDDDSYDIDSWIGDAGDEDWCYTCQEWTECKDDICNKCNNHVDGVPTDEFASGYTAKASITTTPVVNRYGDMWNRGSGFTWGGGTTWWSGDSGSSSLSGMWGTSFHSDDKAKRLQRHKAHLDSLCKVVDPTVKHSLTFASHRTGHTNMSTGQIVIDGGLIESGDDKLDIASGLAIHEKLHLIHSKPLQAWERTEMDSLGLLDSGSRRLFHDICNVVEDEFIEKQLHTTCSGFVHYIEAVKKHYFEGKKDEMAGMKNPFIDLFNTFLLLVRYPSLIDEDRRKRHAPHIRFFAKALKKGLDSRDDTYMCIRTVYDYLKKSSEKMLDDDGPNLDDAMKEAEEAMGDMKDRFEADDISLSEEDWDAIKEKLIEDMKSKAIRDHKKRDPLREAMAEIESTLKTLMDYEAEEDSYIDSGTERKIKELEDSDFSEYDLDKTVPTVSNAQKRITWRTAKEDGASRDRYRIAVTDMKPQINQLKRKLQLYGNMNKYTVRNQKIGKIDKRRLHRIPMGMTDLFKIDITEQDKPLDICLLVDESGSMGYATMEYARNAAICLKEALGSNEQLNLWVFGHSADSEGYGTTEMIEYCSPRMKDRPMAMGGMRARCENRDGNAIIAATQRVLEQTDQPQANKLMIILSDGAPSADKYRGDVAVKHTKRCVDYVEGRKWNVIQLGFKGAYEYYMERMFKNWVYIPNMESLGKDVTKVIRKVLKV